MVGGDHTAATVWSSRDMQLPRRLQQLQRWPDALAMPATEDIAEE
jgi:hypothetical protein